MLRVGLLKRACVEFSLKESFSLVGDSVQSAGKTLNETISRQQRESVTGVRLGRHIEWFLKGKWRQVPFLLHRLKNAFIDGHHPVCTLSHIFRVLRMRHMCADGRSDGAYSFIDGAISAVLGAE